MGNTPHIPLSGGFPLRRGNGDTAPENGDGTPGMAGFWKAIKYPFYSN